MAEKVSPSQIGSPEFSQALLKVLTEDRYSQAARALSRKLRAHKRTPVQQAGGTGTPHKSCIGLRSKGNICDLPYDHIHKQDRQCTRHRECIS